VTPASAIARRAFADARVRNLAFAFFFVLLAYVQPLAYRHSFPTLKERLDFARSFGTEKTVRFFYGTPHDLLSVGGYTAWRSPASSRSSPRSGGCWPQSGHCAPKRKQGAKSSC
jgi:hypothetical protein